MDVYLDLKSKRSKTLSSIIANSIGNSIISGEPSSGSPSQGSRANLLATRLKRTRILRPNKRNSTDDSVNLSGSISSVNPTSALALLGPSRQLAGVVASLSSLDPDTELVPSEKTLTSAWLKSVQPNQNSTFGLDRKDSLGDQSQSANHNPPTQCVPPAACIAAGMFKIYPINQSDWFVLF